MRKGSYSEELVRIVVAMSTADGYARSIKKEDYLSKTACRIPNTLANVRSHSSFTMGPQCPSQVYAARFSATLTQRRNCKSLPGIPPRSRKRCQHRHRDRLHTPSPRWTLSIRVDEAEYQVIGSSATGELVLFGNQGLCQGACIGHNGLGVFHKFRCVHLQQFHSRGLEAVRTEWHRLCDAQSLSRSWQRLSQRTQLAHDCAFDCKISWWAVSVTIKS